MEKKLSLKIHQVIIFQLFSNSIVMKFNMLTVLDGALGFFRVSLSITLTLNLLGCLCHCVNRPPKLVFV